MSRPAATPPGASILIFGAGGGGWGEEKNVTTAQTPPARTTSPPPNQPKTCRFFSCRRKRQSVLAGVPLLTPAARSGVGGGLGAGDNDAAAIVPSGHCRRRVG